MYKKKSVERVDKKVDCTEMVEGVNMKFLGDLRKEVPRAGQAGVDTVGCTVLYMISDDGRLLREGALMVVSGGYLLMM